MLQRGDYAREICYFVVIHASPFPLQPVRAVSIFILFFLPFFLAWHRRLRGDSAPAYATFRCFCIQLYSVFGGQICFKEAIMLVKYATLWLFTLPLSPCNLLGQYPYFFFLSAFFFGVAQAFKRRFCSGI